MKKVFKNGHPLGGEDPDSWNNIPMCVAGALNNFKLTIIEGDESLFDY